MLLRVRSLFTSVRPGHEVITAGPCKHQSVCLHRGRLPFTLQPRRKQRVCRLCWRRGAACCDAVPALGACKNTGVQRCQRAGRSSPSLQVPLAGPLLIKLQAVVRLA